MTDATGRSGRRCWLVPLAAALVLSGARGAEPDVHSFARPGEARVSRVELDLTVNFDAKTIDGAATLQVDRPGAADAPLVLDTRGLNILNVKDLQGRDVPFELGPEDPIKGRALTVRMPTGLGSVRVAYRTTEKASALQWVDPKGTAGKRKPFLFTQSEAIHARSWIPIQDSPAVRVTYAATVRVPAGLSAAMSADRKENADTNTYRFDMPQPVPPYLIALAVGDLVFRPLGERTGVYAEPSVVEAAASEFADTEKMVRAVEARYGPYRWGRYDLLVLPPSFPFGGMENPKLTFATPTVLAGDRSLVSLVAHELAHSWSGNLVTNATWRDFWLNEGFTTYVERRVIEDIFGPGRADMERVLGRRELDEAITQLPPRDQVLHIDLDGRDPDEGTTQVAYEKGALFLTRLEQAFGRDRFDAYLRGYFDRFAFRSITTDDLVRDLRANLFPQDADAARSIDLTAWLERPCVPTDAPAVSSANFARVEAAAADWASGKSPASALRASEWSTQEWVHFLSTLPERLPAQKLAELDRAFGLTQRGNAEVLQKWFLLAIRGGYAPADARLESFLTTVGRRKFLMPLYTELARTPEGKARARAIYARAREFYHPIAVDSVDKLLGKPDAN
jgi:hypothetical protein